MSNYLTNFHVLVFTIISTFFIILVITGACFCIRARKFYKLFLKIYLNPNNFLFSTKDHRQIFGQNQNNNQSINIENESKLTEHREKYYASARKTSTSSPCRDSSGALERIPEYSEDIYPYATFHLPDQENLSGNPNRNCIYESSRDSEGKIRHSKHRSRSKSKSFKSESEEYDSLGSDTDTGIQEHLASRTEDDGPINFGMKFYF